MRRPGAAMPEPDAQWKRLAARFTRWRAAMPGPWCIHLRIRLADCTKTGLLRRRRGGGGSSGMVSSMPGGGPMPSGKAQSLDARGVIRLILAS